jgi:hypothetical protein
MPVPVKLKALHLRLQTKTITGNIRIKMNVCFNISFTDCIPHSNVPKPSIA